MQAFRLTREIMSIAELMLPDFDHETATTRTLLERVPDAKADWKPHVKSMSLGELAVHVSNITGWAPLTLKGTEFDTDPPGGVPYTPTKFESTAKTLEAFDEGVKTMRAMLAATTDGEMMVPWVLKSGGKTVFSMPRVAVFRSFIMNHVIHHRGQLSVYLRLCDVPLPGIYGPTADTREPQV
jgi:uncharacterized damage-inducible protein DinB